MRTTPLPIHFRQKIPQGPVFFKVNGVLKEHTLDTVCEQARCPNRTDCYSRGTVTFQILGDICTRRCGFCAETTGIPKTLDWTQPQRLLQAVKALNLKHVVITAPARDDLEDGGASMFEKTVLLLKQKIPQVTVEILVSDLQGNPEALHTVLRSEPHVFNHNIETVRRLTPKVRSKATYERSLAILKAAADYSQEPDWFERTETKNLKVKSGFMLGLGETFSEILETLQDLKKVGVHYVTIGQYLQPSFKHLPIQQFYSEDEFKTINTLAKDCGFEKVFCGPLIRSSFHAEELV